MDRPNILWILADDLGWGDVGFHGSRIRTPVLDQLGREGVEFGQHYVCPMCTPSRTSLMTGRHPGRFGDHATVPSNAPVLPDGYQTLASMLKDAGYATGLFGKWHMGSDAQYGPDKYGFDYAYGSLAGGIDPYNHRYKRGKFSVTWHRNGQLVEERGHVTDLITDEAIRWLEDREEPWFCYVPYTAVHIPVKPTQQWLSQYSAERFDDDPGRDASFRKYAAYTSHLDEAIGRLLECVERMCQRENTLVVFSSDNGAIDGCPIHSTDRYPGWQEAYPLLGSNAPFRGVKGQLYEGGIRTPTLVSWRGVLEPGRFDAPLHIADWMPTLASLTAAELREDPQWDGLDFGPGLFGGKGAPEDRGIYWNFNGGRLLGMRKGGWKLILSRGEGGPTPELFHVAVDPLEQRECAGEHPELVKQLTALIEEERKLDGVSRRSDVEGPLVD
jgi:arylsulfatase A-like enzyme